MTALRNLLVALALLVGTAWPCEAANRFAVCTVACTWDASSTAMWSTSTGGATGASVPGSGDAVILDAATCVGGVTCTVTVNTTVNSQSITMGACTASTTGCILDFSANNNNVTLGLFSGTGTGTRTLNMGNGTWTITNTSGTVWNMSVTTNQTFAANSSTLLLSATTASLRAFNSAGLTYNVVTFSANTSLGIQNIVGVNTYATMNIAAPQSIQVTAGNTQTITTLNISGTTASLPVGILTGTGGTTTTFAVTNNASYSFLALRDIVFTTGTFSATNSFSLGGVSGITVTGPSGGGGKIIGG